MTAYADDCIFKIILILTTQSPQIQLKPLRIVLGTFTYLWNPFFLTSSNFLLLFEMTLLGVNLAYLPSFRSSLLALTYACIFYLRICVKMNDVTITISFYPQHNFTVIFLTFASFAYQLVLLKQVKIRKALPVLETACIFVLSKYISQIILFYSILSVLF